MRRAALSISALPAWRKLNDVAFTDISVYQAEGKGFGLFIDKAMNSDEAFNMPVLRVPKDLILSTEAIAEHTQVDKDFSRLLDVAGGVSTRGDILLFLLMQITIASLDGPPGVGVSNPWTEYVKMLPSNVPLPTAWTEDQRKLLSGTSLESPLNAKISALVREFERLQDLTSEVSWCRKVWWEPGRLALSDWVLLDSWYRSRCLELPNSRESMVPCLDIVNHSGEPNAYYEQASNGDAVLLLRPNGNLESGEEVTISYGSSKSAAETLFSYGFIDEKMGLDSLVLDLHPLPDDPLGRAKVAAFSGLPMVSISSTADAVDWSSPFLFFACLNEEDGLEFKVLQQTKGLENQLQVFWQDLDVTDSTTQFEQHISQHPLKDVFYLRVACLLEYRIQEQLERLSASEDMFAVADSLMIETDEELFIAALKLRNRETALLCKALNAVGSQKSSLIESPAVVTYFSLIGRTSDIHGGYS